MKSQIFFRGIMVEFFLEKYERTPDLKEFVKVPNVVNFNRLPSVVKTSLPINDYLKQQGADWVLEGKDKKDNLHTGMRKTNYAHLFEGNDKTDQSEIRAYLTNQNRTLWIAFFRSFRIKSFEKGLFNDSLIGELRRLTA